MLEAPRPSLFDPGETLDFTLNPRTGVMSTAFETPQRPPPAAPQVSEPAQPQVDAGTEQFQQFADPSQFSEFGPTSAFEEADVITGKQTDVFSQIFDNETILGFGKQVLSLGERERLSTSISNATANNPWTTTATGMAAHFTGNLPVDIGISLVSGPFGVAWKSLMSARSLKGAVMSARMTKAAKILTMASRPGAPSTGFFMRQLRHAKIDALEGLATGSITETYLQSIGKEGDKRDVLNAAMIDSVGGAVFGLGLRNAWGLSKKTYAKFRTDYIRQSAKDITEVTGIPKEEVKAMLDNKVAKTDAELLGKGPEVEAPDPRTGKAQSVKSSLASKPPDVTSTSRPKIKQTLSKAELKHLDDVGKRATPARTRQAFESLLEDPARAGKLVDTLESRAKSAGMSLPEYFKAKRLKFDVGETISVLSQDGDLILTAPGRSANVSDMLHEIGHIVRSDLDGKHLTDLENFYGVEKGMPWTRDNEELFAEDVRKFLDGEKTEQPRGVRRAMKAVLDWIKNVYGKAFGMPATASRDDVLARLFAENAHPFATPTPIKELRIANERVKAEATQLFAPKQPAKNQAISSEQITEIDNATQVNTQRQREIAEGAAESIARGSKIPDTPAGKRWQKIKSSFGKLFGTNNVSLKGQLSQLGDIGTRIDAQMPRAAIDSARIKTKGEDAYNKFLDDRKWDNDRLLAMTQEKITNTIGGKKITESKLWWVRKVLESMDGWNQAKTKVTKNSAQEKLVTEGFSYKGRTVKVSPEQLKFLQDGARLSDKELELVEAIQNGYREAGREANALVRKLTGRNFVDPDNFYYVSQNTLSGDEVSGKLEVLLPSRKADGGRGAFHERTGGAVIKEAHPINDMNKYMSYVSEVVAYARPAKELEIFLERGGEMIKEKLSAHYLESMTNLSKILSGDRAILGDITDTGISKVYSLTIISQLGANPSVILKQFSSAWTAAATGKLLNAEGKQINGAKLFLEALSFAKDPIRQTELKKVEAEMDLANDYFKQRRISKVRWVELEKIAGELGIYERNGKLSVKTLAALAKKKGITKFDAWIASIEKMTEGIQVADRSQIAAIWNQSKKTVALTTDVKDPSFFDKVSRLAVDITMDSQPTHDVVTKSMNQMNRNIFTKAVTQYTTQTRKIAEMADSTFTTYVNIDKTNMPKAQKDKLKQDLWNAIIPLAIQTGYAAAIGTIVGVGVASVKDLAKSEKQLKRLEKRRDGLMTKFMQNLLQGTVGVAPVAGAPISGMLIALTGGKPYMQNIPVFEQIQSLNDAVFERNTRNALKALMSASGAPSIIADPVATLAGRAAK